MQFAVMVWMNSAGAPETGSIFGILDKSNPGALPVLSRRRRPADDESPSIANALTGGCSAAPLLLGDFVLRRSQPTSIRQRDPL